MKRSLVPALVPAVVLATLATAAIAQNQLTGARDNTRAVRILEHRLSLTPTQIAQAKTVLQQERPMIAQLHTELAAEHTAMAAQTGFDETKTRAIAAQYADANMGAVVEREKLRSELLAILTPAQQEKLQQLRARFGARLDERLQTLGDTL